MTADSIREEIETLTETLSFTEDKTERDAIKVRLAEAEEDLASLLADGEDEDLDVAAFRDDDDDYGDDDDDDDYEDETERRIAVFRGDSYDEENGEW